MSTLRRSERINPGLGNSNPPGSSIVANPVALGIDLQNNEKKEKVKPPNKPNERYFNSPQIQALQGEPTPQETPEIKPGDQEIKEEPITPQKPMDEDLPAVIPVEPDGTTPSATKKALFKMDKKRYPKKNGRSNPRKKLNGRLSKLLAPKNALILINELKPGCVFKVGDDSCMNPPIFNAQVTFKDRVLGVGKGLSKSQAKNAAAEDAIKMIVSESLSSNRANNVEENNPENLPWIGIASFAMYKLFTEWHNQGTDISIPVAPSNQSLVPNPNLQADNKPKGKLPPIKTELPPDAEKLHPSAVLNLMRPGLIAVELDREALGGSFKVRMCFQIDGKSYIGIGGNKKEAKREAAKEALKDLYGLVYPS